MEMGDKAKCKVCVTGGTGFVASWLIMRLLQHGYSVNSTIRSPSAGTNKDISFLTNLPGASVRLRVFYADLDDPDSFGPAIEGCIGVFHVAHPTEHHGKEHEEMLTKKSVQAMLGILRSCLNTKTVKRVVYTSSVSTVMYNDKGPDVISDESSWSDVDYIRSYEKFLASYSISKTLTEKAALEFSEKHGLDVVTVMPSLILGPFIGVSCPGSVRFALAMFIAKDKAMRYYENNSFVHIDDVASAHIFLFENPQAKGRYICSAVGTTNDKLSEFISNRYPEFHTSSADSSTDAAFKLRSISSKKLLEAGFEYKYGLGEMFDEAIECCKQKGFL